jgi:hypothetical protein
MWCSVNLPSRSNATGDSFAAADTFEDFRQDFGDPKTAYTTVRSAVKIKLDEIGYLSRILIHDREMLVVSLEKMDGCNDNDHLILGRYNVTFM